MYVPVFMLNYSSTAKPVVFIYIINNWNVFCNVHEAPGFLFTISLSLDCKAGMTACPRVLTGSEAGQRCVLPHTSSSQYVTVDTRVSRPKENTIPFSRCHSHNNRKSSQKTVQTGWRRKHNKTITTTTRWLQFSATTPTKTRAGPQTNAPADDWCAGKAGDAGPSPPSSIQIKMPFIILLAHNNRLPLY